MTHRQIERGAAYVTSDGAAARARNEGQAKRDALNPNGQAVVPRVARVSAIGRMADAGHLRAEQVRAAHDIESYWHSWTAGLFARPMATYGERLDRGISLSEPISVRSRATRYQAWAAWADGHSVRGGLSSLTLVMDVVVDGQSLEALRMRYRMGTPRIRAVVQIALRRYATMAGWVEDREPA